MLDNSIYEVPMQQEFPMHVEESSNNKIEQVKNKNLGVHQVF